MQGQDTTPWTLMAGGGGFPREVLYSLGQCTCRYVRELRSVAPEGGDWRTCLGYINAPAHEGNLGWAKWHCLWTSCTCKSCGWG